MASNANCCSSFRPGSRVFLFCSQRERARDDQEPLVWPSFHWPLKCSGLTWTNLKSRGHQWKEEARRAEKERKEANVLAKGWWCASHFWIGGPVAEDLLAAFHWQHWPFPPADETIKDGRRKLLALLFFFGHGNIEPAGGICSTCRRPSSGACIDHGEAAADDSDSALPAVDQRARIVQRRLQSEFAPPQGRSEPINYRAESAAKLDAATRETHEMVAFRTLSGQTAALISDEFSGSQSPFGSCFFRQQTSDHVDERVG